ncbi:MAG: class I SAM-dependent methyltransferase [Umezawaea sp.]
MIAEQLVNWGTKLVAGYPPEGRKYWAARFWDRAGAEQDQKLGPHYRTQKAALTDLIKKYGADADTIVEFACGTGEFSMIAAEVTNAGKMVALDISAEGLSRTRERVKHPNLRLVQGDFWSEHDLPRAPLVLCVDAIHHIGEVRSVLRRLRGQVSPGGVLVGNLWTVDHFHEVQRQRYGWLRHTTYSAFFLGSALLLRATGGRIRTSFYRTQLLRSAAIPALLEEEFDKVLDIVPDRYFVGFACAV